MDRDLLALRYTMQDLELFGAPADRFQYPTSQAWRRRTVTGPISSPACCGRTRAAVAAALDQAARRLAPNGTIVTVGGSTAVSRLIAHVRAKKKLTVEDRKRRGGLSLLVMRGKRSS
ncbi:MAG: hypothetical protein WKH64_15610 [Chloroflexia bacterium]